LFNFRKVGIEQDKMNELFSAISGAIASQSNKSNHDKDPPIFQNSQMPRMRRDENEGGTPQNTGINYVRRQEPEGGTPQNTGIQYVRKQGSMDAGTPQSTGIQYVKRQESLDSGTPQNTGVQYVRRQENLDSGTPQNTGIQYIKKQTNLDLGTPQNTGVQYVKRMEGNDTGTPQNTGLQVNRGKDSIALVSQKLESLTSNGKVSQSDLFNALQNTLEGAEKHSSAEHVNNAETDNFVNECVSFIERLNYESEELKKSIAQLAQNQDAQILAFYRSLKKFPDSFVNVTSKYVKYAKGKNSL
jgi:hypothetical protein